MKLSDCVCCECGDNALQASVRGAYLERANEKGVAAIWRCAPSCGRHTGDAIIKAIEGHHE